MTLYEHEKEFLTEEQEAERTPTGATVFWAAFGIIVGSLIIAMILMLLLPK